MGEIKQTNIKNRTYYFYNLSEFDGCKIKVDKNFFNDINVNVIIYGI